VENINSEYQTSAVKGVAQLLSKKYGKNLLKKSPEDSELFFLLRQESLEFLLCKIKTDLKECGVFFDS
jgi:hypothetical protein